MLSARSSSVVGTGAWAERAPRRRRGRAGRAAEEPAPDDALDEGAAPPGRRWRPGPGIGWGISGPGPSRRDPQPLGGIAARFVAQRGWTRPVSVGGVVGRWREVVGDQLADHCDVETFEEGELVVRASSTAWATQVRLLLPQLERRLAEEVGEGTVTSIVVLGPGGPSWKHGTRAVRGRGPRDTYG
nr:DciA family protein [Georgenia sp. SYP-B2076]